MSGVILKTEALLEGNKSKNLEEVSRIDSSASSDDDDDDGIIEINENPSSDSQSQRERENTETEALLEGNKSKNLEEVSSIKINEIPSADSQSQIISSDISFNISSAPPTDGSSPKSSSSMVHRYRQALAKYFTSHYRYEVFLSFRGADTRKAFTDHLYAALVRASIHTFRDECDLEKGENIKSELHRAIEESRIAIIVFSKKYASSEWCLDELVRIFERKRTTGLRILPVFYDVQPSQVRNHARNLGNVFLKTEQMDKVEEWKIALREAADLGGMVLQNESDGHESKFIEEVVAHVKSKLDVEAAANRWKRNKLLCCIFTIVFLVIFFFYLGYRATRVESLEEKLRRHVCGRNPLCTFTFTPAPLPSHAR